MIGRALALLTALALPAAALAQRPANAAAEPMVAITLRPEITRPGTTFEGWGTALAWFADVTGGYPDPVRERLADLFYSPAGLGFTIARYNIGGGNSAATPPYLRPGGAVPGFWRQPAGTTGNDWWQPDEPAMWDWSADARQRWWLDAITRRVKTPIFEAFSNSPPWFMTVSGRVSGAEKGGDDNLRPGQEGRFATYLARVVDELQRRHRIAFRTLSPVNEPNTDFWFAANKQEGSHWSPARQAAMIDASVAALARRRLATVIAAPDETNAELFLADWAGFPAATRARIAQLNVHSYGTLHQTGVRDIARVSGIRLWMSENDTPGDKLLEDFADIRPALALADHIVADLKRLEPAAWVFWQAVEDLTGGARGSGSNWGLVKMDLAAPTAAPHPISITAKYWGMMVFTHAIRPGYRLIRVDDPDTVGAVSADGRELALVHVNAGLSPRRLTVAVRGAWTVATTVTATGRNAVAMPAGPATASPAVVAPPGSITGIRLTRR